MLTIDPSRRTIKKALAAASRAVALLLLVLACPPAGVASPTTQAQPIAATGARAPKPVRVNKTVPPVTPPSPEPVFDVYPSDEQLFYARAFEEPLVPQMAGFVDVMENRALADALLAFLHRSSNDDVAAITAFIEAHPRSRWRLALLTNLGIIHAQAGWYSKALDAWEAAWAAGKGETEARAHALTDRAAAELARLRARLGHQDRLDVLLADVGDRDLRGSAAELLSRARADLAVMKQRPETAFTCGAHALGRLLAARRVAEPVHPKIESARSGSLGMSLVDVRNLANDLGLKARIAKREPGAPPILPAVVHFRVGHYTALLEEQAGSYRVDDPTMQGSLWISKAALDAESSGYSVVLSEALPDGWRPVDDREGATVRGRGIVSGSDGNATKCNDTMVCNSCNGPGMATYNFHAMLVSLHITDTPVGYAPPVGPAVPFTVTYNQREANQPANFDYSNFGPKWTFNWMAYVTDNPPSTTQNVSLYVAGGGTEIFVYDSATQGFLSPIDDRSTLARTGPAAYERRLRDGSKEIYSQPGGIGASGRKVFLTQVVDPAGNAVTLTYDPGTLRIVAITDAIDQVTTLSYGLPAPHANLITAVTAPFGREATFEYNVAGQLVKITDVVGITSEFTYGPGDFIDSLTTPYGTTTFATGGSTNPLYTWLEATDPNLDKQRLELAQQVTTILYSDPVAPAMPVQVNNQYLNSRSTFYWDKKAMASFAGDYTKARIYHWNHTTNINILSNILESTKEPLESRIWYEYKGQTSPGFENQGMTSSPAYVGRLLDDGSTQLWKYQYNSLGQVTQAINPAGRTTEVTYAANGIDVVKVEQALASAPGTKATLVQATYNAQHLPLTVKDASGRTTTLTYNDAGQLLTATNPLGETTTLTYDADGYLTSIEGPDPNNPGSPVTLSTFTYVAGRVETAKDSEGYELTFTYDALDRPLTVTYPDGTTEQIVYERLDPQTLTYHPSLDAEAFKDRMGRWTYVQHNALRQVVAVQDKLGRTTELDWCKCGSLARLIDPMGRITTWERDLQGRATSKVYDDQSEVRYAYENTTSRLRSVTDPRGVVTSYTYFVDDNLRRVSYAAPAGIAPTPAINFTYDQDFGRLTTMVDGLGKTTYAYHPITGSASLGAGMPASIDGPLPNDTQAFTYDALGRVVSRSVGGVAESVLHDALGRVTSLTNALGTFGMSYVDVTGRPSAVSYPNGVTTSYAYLGNTGDQRLQSITHARGSTLISKFDYTYAKDGSIATWSQQADATPPRVYNFRHDHEQQLTGAVLTSQGATLKSFFYGYDAAGNRTHEQIDRAVSTATYNELNQLMSMDGGGPLHVGGTLTKWAQVSVNGMPASVAVDKTFEGFAQVTPGSNTLTVTATRQGQNAVTKQYSVDVSAGNAGTRTYDEDGNVLHDTIGGRTRVFEWDAAGRMVKITVTDPAAPATVMTTDLTYDGSGRLARLVEKDNGSTVSDKRLVWCDDEVCEERDASGSSVAKRFYGGGAQVNAGAFYYDVDHLGSVREMTDATGAVRARYDYDPYGVTTKVSGDVDGDFGYAGYRRHARSGLELTWFRAYDAATGRWMSRDPIEERGGVNLYGYVGNGPTDATDPFGLAWYSSWNEFLNSDGMMWAVNSTTANAFAGLGDGISSVLPLPFNLSDAARDMFGSNCVVSKCSGTYRAGWWTGAAYGVTTFGVGSLATSGGKAVFYSGGKGVLNAARTFAQGRGLQLMENTVGGRILNSRYVLPIMNRIPGGWSAASAVFAANARGGVSAVLYNPELHSVWVRIERPILRFMGQSIKTYVLAP